MTNCAERCAEIIQQVRTLGDAGGTLIAQLDRGYKMKNLPMAFLKKCNSYLGRESRVIFELLFFRRYGRLHARRTREKL